MLLVSDVRMFRDAVARWCSRHSLVRIVATAGHHDEATLHARRHAADVALLDMRMPDSLATAHAVAEVAPGVKLVGLGLSETEENVLVYAEAGFAGYVPREAPLEDLVPVLRSIGRGEARYSPRIAATLLRRLASLADPRGIATDGVRLTPREVEIVRLIDEGLSNREIGRRLSIEVATVKNHVHNILDKLRVHRRGEAAARLRPRALHAVARGSIPA